MHSLGIWHWMLVLAVFLPLFGGGRKISELIGDFAQGINGGGGPDGFV
jgi:sec-independent protein translocase protein TatA